MKRGSGFCLFFCLPGELSFPAGYETQIGFLSFFVCRVDEANMFFGK